MRDEILMSVHPVEAALLQTLRELKFGSLQVKVQDGLPVHGGQPLRDFDFVKIAKERKLAK